MRIVIAGAEGTGKSLFMKEYLWSRGDSGGIGEPIVIKTSDHVVLFLPGKHLKKAEAILSRAFKPDLILVFFDCNLDDEILQDYNGLFDFLKKEKTGKTVMIFPRYCTRKHINSAVSLIKAASGVEWDDIIGLGEEDAEKKLEKLGLKKGSPSAIETRKPVEKKKKESEKAKYIITSKDKVRAKQIKENWVVRVVKPLSNGIPPGMRPITNHIYDGIRVDSVASFSGVSVNRVKLVLAMLERKGYIILESDTPIENIL